MSIINHMLSELEKRKQQFKPLGEQLLTGLSAPARRFDFHIHYAKLLWAIAGIIAVLLVWYGIPWLAGSSDLTEELVPSSELLSLPDTEQVPPLDMQAQASTQPNQSVLQDMTVSVDGTMTTVTLRFNSVLKYELEKAKESSQLLLTLLNTALQRSITDFDLSDTALEQLLARSKNNSVEVIFRLRPEVHLQTVKLEETEQPRLTLTFKSMQNIQKSEDRGASIVENKLKKTRHHITPAEQAEKYYKLGVKLITEGDASKAEAAFEQGLSLQPDHIAMRELLVALYIEQRQFPLAKQSLQPGIINFPTHSGFAKLEARLLLQQREPRRALDTLLRAVPSIHESPDYHAFMAALFQQVGEPDEAIEIYQALLKEWPDKAIWWMGLAVSLQRAGRFDEALTTYVRAESTGGLSDQLQAYIDEQINLLKK